MSFDSVPSSKSCYIAELIGAGFELGAVSNAVILFNTIILNLLRIGMQQKKLGAYVRSNEDYYAAMVSHGYIMPTLSCALVTRGYMDGVRKGEYYCPHKSQDIPKLCVANPPPKLELLKIWKRSVYKAVQERTLCS